MRHNLGDTIYWVYATTNYGKKVPCSMCFGKRFVTIILGDDSKTEIECGYCAHGIERPSGLMQVWEPIAEVRSGIITGISNRDGTRYEVMHQNLFAHEVYATEAEAKLIQEVKLAEVKAQAEQWFKDSFVNAKKKQIWSAGYHKRSIADAERTISWHQHRLNMIKAKPTPPLKENE